MKVQGPWPAMLFTVLTCAMPAWAASDGADSAKYSVLIATRMAEIGDTGSGQQVMETLDGLESQRTFLDDSLRLFDPEIVALDTDPYFRKWWGVNLRTLRAHIDKPALISKKYAKKFARLDRRSPSWERIRLVDDFQHTVDDFALALAVTVANSWDTLPLEDIDARISSIKQRVNQALGTASGSSGPARREVESIGMGYVKQYDYDQYRDCREGIVAKFAAERERMRSRLREMRETEREFQVDSTTVATISRLYDDILSTTNEDQIVARQSLIYRRYCLRARLHKLMTTSGRRYMMVH